MPERDLKKKLTSMVRQEAEERQGAVSDRGRFTYVVRPQDGDMTVKQILKRKMGFSSRLLSRLKREGRVTRNGREVRLFADVIEGDVIQADLPEEKCSFIPQDIPVETVYEDEDMIVIDKQPGIVTHPTKGHPVGTIANGLMKYMEQKGISFKIRFVNRLDMNTSGLLMVAKNSHCQDAMMKQMRGNKVEKTYIAIVHGIIEEERGTIDLPIGRPDPEDIRRSVTEDGSPSITHYRVLERFRIPEEDRGGYTLVRLRLETGRTHQIRVHMAHCGHPLIGDTLYGGEDPELIGRQALHAASLSFFQPVTGEPVRCEAPLPGDMQRAVEILREKSAR